MHGMQAARRVLRALPVLVLWLLASTASAGSFRISPTLAEVVPGASVASFHVTNSGTEPLPMQIEAFAWTQDEGADRHVPAADLVIVPRIATIPPGQTQLIRVARRSAAREREVAYRIHFVELPLAGGTSSVEVRTTVRFDVPLFFAAGDDPAKLRWSLALAADGKARLNAENLGGQYVRVASLRLVDARGALLAERKGPLYVLAGRASRWPLTTHARLRTGDTVILEADLSGRADTQSLIIQ